MKITFKPLFGSVSALIVLSGALCQTVHAQSVLVEQGTAILADSLGANSGPEALPVSYAVSVDAGIYTYTYSILNPTGDVLLNNDGSPSATPEIVDAFSVSFNTTAPNAYIAGTQAGGTSDQNNGVAGLFWSFTAVNPGTTSPVLSFESYLPPTLGNANAQDANPPSPLSSNPNGQQVPVPSVVPEPGIMALFFATGLVLLPFRTKVLSFLR